MDAFYIFLAVMSGMAVIVFVALYFVKAGYGMFFDAKWGRPIDNRIGWVLMEAPVFIAMACFWYFSDRRCELVPLIFFVFFEIHYFQRSFIFPLLLKGKGRMPMGIMLMGITFNVLSVYARGMDILFCTVGSLYPGVVDVTAVYYRNVIIFCGDVHEHPIGSYHSSFAASR